MEEHEEKVFDYVHQVALSLKEVYDRCSTPEARHECIEDNVIRMVMLEAIVNRDPSEEHQLSCLLEFAEMVGIPAETIAAYEVMYAQQSALERIA